MVREVGSGDNLWESVLCPHYVGCGDQTQVFYLLAHLKSPIVAPKEMERERLLKDFYSLYHIPETTTIKIGVYISWVFRSLGLGTFDLKQKKPLLYSTYLLMEAHIKIYENILFPILFIVVH